MYVMQMSSLDKIFFALCAFRVQCPDRHSLANQVPAAYNGTALAVCAIPATGVMVFLQSQQNGQSGGCADASAASFHILAV